jgi:hypothetical protein
MRRKRVEINYLDFFQEPIAPADPCHPLSDEERAAAMELFRDDQSFAQRWN